MRIGIINTTDFGSTGNIAKTIGELLIKSGNQVILFCGQKRDKKCVFSETISSSKSADFLSNFASKVHGLDGFFNKNNTLYLIKRIKEFNPQVLHIHNLHGSYINLPILMDYLSQTSIRLIFTMHDCWLFTGKCPYFDLAACDQWESGCFNCPAKKSYPRSFLKPKVKYAYELKKQSMFKLNHNNCVFVTPSEWLNNLAKKSFLGQIETASFVVINNGIDKTVFFKDCDKRITFRNENKINSEIVFLAVANPWSERKGLSILNEVSLMLVDKKHILYIAGLKEKDKTHNSIRRIGIVDKNELSKLYNGCDYFLNPSFEDNYPTTLLESIACGTPVISFDTGGCKEIAAQYGAVTGEKTAKGLLEVIDKLERKKILLKENGHISSTEECAIKYVELIMSMGEEYDN